ncbi:sulfotransferase family protein [Maritimibacter sp. 55A14]|uniref:sulfotransferase-like domain-containing protein n=1 Tax=Maritimibacter sp. 55A14 TaxID=2174844 RepID=UPI000D60573E|nr:sulfotransferase family protein [Maritimibacter sp. 55A14]PWE30062.1 sulfotransferase family protein [Maritimibacter sp. 55A14]
MRIAMWSGPRNLSTAMMYAFAARGDTAVWDEPFYAAYLRLTGRDHPMREQIIAAGDPDPARVAARLTGSVPGGKPVFYQKHMTQHMVPGVPRGWMRDCTNVFLIRHPARVVASFTAKRENPDPDEIGFRLQAELFDELAEATGAPPLVIDSHDIRDDPGGTLSRFCARMGLDYTPAMLTWPAGGHPDDGVWAAHWYGAVHRSTGFAGAEGPLPEFSGAAARMAETALPFYERLAAFRI